jgi:murein tripeptide amidase MpaA
VQIRTAADLKAVLALTDDVWSHRVGVGGPLDARVSPGQYARLVASGIPSTVLIENIQALVDREGAQIAAVGGADGPGWFSTYHSYDEVRGYAQNMAVANPWLVTSDSAGTSLLGKDMFALRITGPGSTATRPQILINACQHAREWISVSTAMYLADQLVARYSTDPQIKNLVDNIEFLFVPITNPDGYDYTWTTNRLWRKNLRDNGNGCLGVDNNRNWGYQWGGQGASTNPCNDIYRGPSGFSEPETQALRDYTIANPRICAAIDFHSYSQLVMSPWGYSNTIIPPPDGPLFTTLTTTMQSAISGTYGVAYGAGPVYVTIYPASGVTVDWWYGVQHLYGLTIELRDTGNYGFMLPADQIVPVGQENLAGLRSLADFFMPVRFSMPSPIPEPLVPGATTPVQVSISAGNGGSIAPGSQLIYTRIGTSGAFASAPLTLVGGTTYQGLLPAAPCGTPVQFYFEAAASGGPTLQYPGASAPLSSTPYQQSVVFYDDMEIDRGWTVQNDPSLTEGWWERVVPVPSHDLNGELAAPDQDASSLPGGMCWVTENGQPGAAAGLSDVDGGPTMLISPVFDLSGAQQMMATYARWCYSAYGMTDELLTQVSNDGGLTWVQVDHTGTTHGWQMARFLLPPGMTPTSAMQIRFSIADNPDDSLTEGGIDEVTVYALTCPVPPCYANCDGSTVPPVLTANDFQCFLNRFAAGDSYANCDGSSVPPVLNANDFACFLNQFAAGCS